MLAGPYCGMLLGDLGAEVIKVETGDGDIARSAGTHAIDGHNIYFASLNRNKKSVTLDLADPASRKKFEALIATSHALITNVRPRAIRKLGLTYEQLRPVIDDRFAAMDARSKNRELVIDSVQFELLRRTSAEWIDRLQSLGIVIAATSRLEDALTGENAAARGMVVSICTPAGKLRLVGNPIKVDGFQETFRAPPRLGEDEELLERLGDGA